MNKDVVLAGTSSAMTEVLSAAEKIGLSWRKTTESIIETGNLLLTAERSFNPSQFRSLTQNLTKNWGISPSVISKLKKIAGNPVLIDPTNIARLPPSYATLYEIALVDEGKLKNAISDGTISPKTQLKDVFAKFPKNARASRASSTTQAAVLTVSYRGGAEAISDEDLDELKGILDRLDNKMSVVRRGLP